MSRIRGKNTTPEIAVRRLLHRMGYRFRLHVRIPIGEPLQKETKGTKKGRIDEGLPIPQIKNLRFKIQDRDRPSTLNKPRYIRPDIVLPKYKRCESFAKGW